MIDNKVRRKPGAQRAQWVTSRDGRGQSLVEMAIITPLLLLLFVGVLEVGWAIRGYIVLVNANREATRFAARGPYLDFSQSSRDAVGYDSVLLHTIDSIAQQLPFDVRSDDPNGTLIVSHYLVDTGKPCEEPPCNDTCAADSNNNNGLCDCSAPDRREADYPGDDLILHPGLSGYEHFSALYGITRTSRINHEQVVAELKQENDALNCALNLKDPAAPWSTNSVVLVEAFYDQPQLLGVPFISNRLTDPIPFYAHTMMRIAPGGSDAEGCPVYPIAINHDTLVGISTGDYIEDGWDGTGSGDFGWLRWNPDPSNNNANYLNEELSNPKLALNDFTDDQQPDDHMLNAGDHVAGLTGVVNADDVRAELESLIGKTIRIVVWDAVKSGGTGEGAYYYVERFVKVKIVEPRLPGKIIDMVFMEEDPNACPGDDPP